MKKCDWGWQGDAKKLRLRAEYLLTNLVSLPIPADITFEFDKDGLVETLSAHKIFLAIGSEVFMAMFYGPAADATQTNLLIPNYSKTVFEVLVHYLYSDRIPENFTALEDDGLWMELLECALQYGMPDLTTKCRVAVDELLASATSHGSSVNVCRVLAEAKRLEEMEIEELAWRALDKRPIRILSRSLDVSRELLTEILQRSELKIDEQEEIDLYNVARRWASANNGQEQTLPALCSEACGHCILKKDPVRQLGPAFKHIRFPLMSPSQLADGPVKDGVFTPAEMSELIILKLPEPVPRRIVSTQFSSLPRMTKKCLAAGQICFQYNTDRYPIREDGWQHMFHLSVIPNRQACPETSRRFIELCQEDYQFALTTPNKQSAVVHFWQPKFDKDPSQEIQELFLPLPTTENSLMHDSGGTVSLLLIKDENGEGSHYKLFISPDNELKLEDTGVVFGRLRGWSSYLRELKTCANLSSVLPCSLRVCSSVEWLEPYFD